ncbi:MAG TPA: hypothetical protein VN317_08500, partial [Candidatus Methanoperedens sp.]|nr:hypothetical protein [Candidatus Methanoperedens sp.]
ADHDGEWGVPSRDDRHLLGPPARVSSFSARCARFARMFVLVGGYVMPVGKERALDVIGQIDKPSLSCGPPARGMHPDDPGVILLADKTEEC